MSRKVAIPYFPTPPAEYDQRYIQEVVRAFSVYAQQLNNPGPLRATELTLTDSDTNVDRGQLSWNITEETVDITMGDGVVQQVGFETFMQVKNDTGSQIDNGRVVGFVGVNSEIKIAEYTANSSANELYFIGVTTRDMPDGDVGPVTLYGKVRGLDTTGQGGETWNVGDILYASPTTAGGLTNVRPTAPNVVISVAAVLSVDATDGEIMVRPRVPVGLDYGAFDSTTDQTLVAINTGKAIALENTLSSNGVTTGTPNSRIVVSEAGFYKFDASFQFTSTNVFAKTVYFWLTKNGSEVADTTRVYTLKANGDQRVMHVTYGISLAASDYVEFYWASTDTAVTLDAITGIAFAPDVPSAIVTVTQIQL